jgi:hypothetical protein
MTKRFYKITQGAFYRNENGKKKVYQAETDNNIVELTEEEASRHPHLQLRQIFVRDIGKKSETKLVVNPANKGKKNK